MGKASRRKRERRLEFVKHKLSLNHLLTNWFKQVYPELSQSITDLDAFLISQGDNGPELVIVLQLKHTLEVTLFKPIEYNPKNHAMMYYEDYKAMLVEGIDVINQRLSESKPE